MIQRAPLRFFIDYNQLRFGELTTAVEVAVSTVLGTVGTGIGARFGNSVASNLDDMASGGGIKEVVSTATRSSYQAGGDLAEAATSIGGKVGGIAAEATTNYVDQRIDQMNEDK